MGRIEHQSSRRPSQPRPTRSQRRTPAAASFKALVFTKVAGYPHDSRPVGAEAIRKLGAEHNFTVDVTEDAAAFTDQNLAQYQVVIWLSTTGDVLNADQKAAFERYIKAGGGYAGVHAASDNGAGFTWTWYQNLVGGVFKGQHTAGGTQATVKVLDPAHPSTKGMLPEWVRKEEWYPFKVDPRRNGVHVLAEVKESTFSPAETAPDKTMGAEHPISGCQDFDGGRSWYTAMGHDSSAFSEPQFLQHLLGGIQSAAGVVGSNCSASQDSAFDQTNVSGATNSPMEMDIAADGRIFYIERGGAIRMIPTGRTEPTSITLQTLSVNQANEAGGLGIALAPDFATSNTLYVYWAPSATPGQHRLSQFTYVPGSNTLTNEKTVMTVDLDRRSCCHSGGAIEFDAAGNLFISTGDNTSPGGKEIPGTDPKKYDNPASRRWTSDPATSTWTRSGPRRTRTT